jgi:hypothetical protein
MKADKVLTEEDIKKLNLEDSELPEFVREPTTLKILDIQTEEALDYFELTVLFSMETELHLLDKFMNWHRVHYVNDPKVYESEISKQNMVFTPIEGSENFCMTFEGPPLTDDLKVGYSHGNGMITKLEDGTYQFHEFFTKTPVTLAALSELQKMKDDPTHSLWSIPEYYFCTLLDVLATYWD